MSQVDAVRRKLVASLNKQAIDMAVDAHGFERSLIEDVLVLCGNSQEKVAQQWTNWRATLTEAENDSNALDLQEFVDFLRAAPPPTDKRKRHRAVNRKAKQAANRVTKSKKTR